MSTRLRSTAVLVVMAMLTVLTAVPAGARGSDRSVADVTVEVDCDAGTIEITSSKELSNIVYSIGGEHSRIEFEDDPAPYSYSLPLDGVETVWVKSGNNHSGDGPGYGERFDIPADACQPADADGDGYPADTDCDDSDPSINPGAVDIPNNGIDENCDGSDLIVTEGELRFTLTWDTDDDLDLHVTDPFGEKVWYQNPTSASGGELDRDDNVGVCGIDSEPGGVENIIWTTTPASGDTYLWQVVSYNDCDEAVPVNFTLQVFLGGTLVQSVSGTASPLPGGGDTAVISSDAWTAP